MGADVAGELDKDEKGEDDEHEPDSLREFTPVLLRVQVIGGAVHVAGGSINRGIMDVV